jgi:crotonobetainyl-CoA:carnitine CoA-transferase CaiB-like acyl-CoA transferase
VVTENFRPGVTGRLGIDYETLSAERPDLVYCSLTGFGPRGRYAHYKGYEGVVAAKSGRMMMFSGQTRRDGPNYVAVQGASHSAAMAIIRGVISALYVRDKTGQGQKVETNLLRTVTPFDHCGWIQGQMAVNDPVNYPADQYIGLGRPNPTGYLATRTKDGHWMQLGNIVERLFREMMGYLGMSYVYEDPRFRNAPSMTEKDREELEKIMLESVREKTLAEWMDIFVNQTANVAAEPYMTSQEAMKHPQVLHNGQARDLYDPRLGATHQLGPLALMRETPGGPKGPAPYPGQHTGEVLGSLNGAKKEAANGSGGPLPKHPLEGVTVLDLGTVINGPLGCALLTELGARVIRIEAPDGDYSRHSLGGLPIHRTMAGTEGVCLNLKTTEGQEIVHKLAAKADILLHSMRPGAPERTGIGYEQLSKINPRLVYFYAGGYGSTGPHSHRPSMAPIAGAVCGGAMTQIGRDTVPPPDQDLTIEEIQELSWKLGRANDGSNDHNASMVNSVAMLMGLYAREHTGRGQYIESNMLGANGYANVNDFFWHEGKAPRQLPDPEGYGLNALYRLYRARKGWVFLACPFEEEWRALCQAIGRHDLFEDPRFATSEAREENDAALAEQLEQVFAAREPLEWEKLLTDADVACVHAEDRGMYWFYDEDPHVRENGFLTEVESARLGKFWRYSPLLSFSHTAGRAGPGPLKGEHTQAILQELGYDEEEARDFKERGIADWEEP